jgi:hypothetical protein
MKKFIGLLLEICSYLVGSGLFIYDAILGYGLIKSVGQTSNSLTAGFEIIMQGLLLNIMLMIGVISLICLCQGFILTRLREGK